MTNEQILKKAIEKAFNDVGISDGQVKQQIQQHGGYRTIFSHRFAKAFWGEARDVIAQSRLNPECKIYKHYGWQYHLQQLVLESEPLKYIEKFL